MNAIKTVIIENDDEALKYLSSVIDNNFHEIKICGTAKSVEDGLQLINRIKPELVMLDIELDGGDAFDILEQVEHNNFEVIFTTGFNTYHEKAFEHFAFCYLLKPIDTNKLDKAISRYKNVKQRLFNLNKFNLYKEFIRNEDSRLLIHTGDSHMAVNLSEIIYCEAEGNYTKFILKDDKSILGSNTLKYYEELLQFKAFFRANRFTLANIRNISSIYKKETLILSNGVNINVSVRNKSKLTDLITQLS